MKNAIDVHIERLRHLEPVHEPIPTTGQLQQLAQDVSDLVPLSQTVSRPEFEDANEDIVASFAEKFGKFLSQSNKGRDKAAPLAGDDIGMLFDYPTRDEVHRIRASWKHYQALEAAGKAKQYKKSAEHVSAQELRLYRMYMPASVFEDAAAPVIIPEGWDQESLGRNIITSVAAMVNTMPTQEEIDRYWTRNFIMPTPVLTAEHLHLLRWIASHDLGFKLEELDGTLWYINSLLVQAYDVLDQYRRDAIAACQTLSSPDAAYGDLDELKSALSAVSWLNQGVAERTERAVEIATGDPGNTRLRAAVATRLRALVTSLETQVGALVDIKHLNEGHVIRLCQRIGLDVDAAEERKAREQIRTRLIDIGLGADIDRELPAGLDAWRNGQLAEFYASREAAARGELVDETVLELEPDSLLA
jgi:hypothetical protein